MNVLDILIKVLPIALQIVPLVEKLFTSLSGAEKKDIAISLINPAVQAAEAAAGKEIVDEVALTSAADTTVDGVVDILNITGVFGKDNDEVV